MGSCLNPLFADTYMDYLENNTLNAEKANVHVCFGLDMWTTLYRVFVVQKGNYKILFRLKYAQKSIQFTVVTKNENNTLHFLDLSITRSNSGFAYKIYRKPSHTDVTIP